MIRARRATRPLPPAPDHAAGAAPRARCPCDCPPPSASPPPRAARSLALLPTHAGDQGGGSQNGGGIAGLLHHALHGLQAVGAAHHRAAGAAGRGRAGRPVSRPARPQSRAAADSRMWAGRAHLLCWTWHFLTATELGAKAVATILSGEEVQAAEGDGAGRRGGRGEDRRMSALSPAKSFPPPTSCFPPCLTRATLFTAWVAGLSCFHARLGLATRDQRPRVAAATVGAAATCHNLEGVVERAAASTCDPGWQVSCAQPSLPTGRPCQATSGCQQLPDEAWPGSSGCAAC